MPATKSSLVAAATAEWNHWGQSKWILATNRRTIGHTDDERSFARYAIDTYCSVVGDKPSEEDVMNDVYFWSAVCNSYIIRQAGFAAGDFPLTNAHSVYLRRFIKARKTSSSTAKYWGYRLTEPEASPQVGDIIGCVRDSSVSYAEAQTYYDRTSPYPSHADIVVARRANAVDAIGGNVLDSVTRTTWPLDAAGRIANRSLKPFVVLRLRNTPDV